MKKFLVLLLAVTMLLALAPAAYAAGRFTDVPDGMWFSEAVAFVTQRGYYVGVTETEFGPDITMTRGMVVTVLGRISNVSNALTDSGMITKNGVNFRAESNTNSQILAVLNSGTSVEILGTENNWYRIRVNGLTGYVRNDLMTKTNGTFSDVPRAMYYTPYIEWAAREGIVSGMGNGIFAPDMSITREQLCAIFYNFAKRFDVPLQRIQNAGKFADDAEISDWAKTAVYTMRDAGIITGMDATHFAPQGQATRAQVAMLLMRFINTVGQSALPNVGVQYGVPIPESSAVSDGWFAGSCFIGHSMVVGMSNYFNLPNADFLAVNGASAAGLFKFDYFDLEEMTTDEDGEEVPVRGNIEDILQEREASYNKVYIMLGTNDLGPKPEHINSFAAYMKELIALVRETQPGAQIYLINIPPVTEKCSEDSENFNLQNIRAYNERLAAISASEKVYLLDVFSILVGEDGYLPEDHALADGLHILAPQYAMIKNYLKTHVV